MINVSDSVRFANAAKHEKFPNHYPAYGTVGYVVGLTLDQKTLYVQWEACSTSENDVWACPADDVEKLPDAEKIIFELRNCAGGLDHDYCKVCSRRKMLPTICCWNELMREAADVLAALREAVLL